MEAETDVNYILLTGKYGEASMAGYTQSPGGFGSPAASQGGDKKGVSLLKFYIKPITLLIKTLRRYRHLFL